MEAPVNTVRVASTWQRFPTVTLASSEAGRIGLPFHGHHPVLQQHLEVGARIAIEAAHADFWYKYVGLEGRVIGMTTYGESAPAAALFEEFGFTLENILGTAEELLED